MRLEANLPLPQLLYPIPGSTGVPDNADILVVAGVGPASGTLYVSPGSGVPIQAQALGGVPSPGPSPAATTPAGETAQAAVIPNLASGQTYTVKFTSVGPSPCIQGQYSGNIGSFTTQ